MTSEDHWNWSNDAENSASLHMNQLYYKYIKKRKLLF